MKKIFVLLGISLFLQLSAYSQLKITSKNDQVYVNKEHVLDIILRGYGQEIIVKNKAGDIILTFLQFKFASGYSSSTSVDSKGRYSSNSGTTYTYYYQVTDPSGNRCEVGYWGLQNRRNIAKYLLDNNLLKEWNLDPEAFLKFCNVHGNNYSTGH